MPKSKQNALLLLCTVSILILILAMSLSELALSAGQPFSLGEGQLTAGGGAADISGGGIFLLIVRGMIGIAALLLPIYLISSLFSKEGRKRLLFNAVLAVIVFAFAMYLQGLSPEGELPEQAVEQSMDSLENFGVNDVPDAVFSPEPPTWITPFVVVLGSVLVAGILYGVSRLLLNRAKPTLSPLEEFAQEAQQALESLNTGQDFKVTVIHCYQEMARIIKEQQGIEREHNMTVREFEDYLINAGLPEAAIKMLSRLFEGVRYGGVSEQSQDEELAIACLADIVEACRS